MTRKSVLRSLLPALVVALVFGAGYRLGGRGDVAQSTGDAGPAAHVAAPSTWTCSMHPQIKLPKFGQCPICFMDLIPLETGTGDEEGPTTLVMSERAAALAEIRTVPVARRAISAEVRLIGTVTYDETLYRTITAWVPGRIDALFADFTGTTVAVGDNLVTLFSPRLFAAQTELLNAIAADRSVSHSASQLVRETSAATVESARRRLRLWGLDDAWIAAVEERGTATHHVDIPSPLGGVVVHKNAVEGLYVETGTALYTVADLSRVWIDLEAYESDLAWLRVGQDIVFSVEALPGETMHGSVIFIAPVLDPRKRTVKVRLAADNADGRLKPGMFAGAVVSAAPDGAGDALVIPASAPMITGKRAVVYVRLPDREKPTFEGRVVELGPRAGDAYLVAAGLVEGELVVVNGNFKIDSALQIQAKPSMMNPAGGGPVPGHQHGEPAPAPAGHDGHDERPVPDEVFTAPVAFRAQLDAVLTAYLAAQAALAADDDGQAAVAAATLAAVLGTVDMMLLAGAAHDAWMTDRADLDRAAGKFASAADIAGRRAVLQVLTERLWTALARFGVAGEGTVRKFHCPMANDSQGADWLQSATAAANPYFGAAMLRCGSQTDSLTVATAEGR